jgi:CRP/FNR family transcriptional regulator, cyclic AMP receptor protein
MHEPVESNMPISLARLDVATDRPLDTRFHLLHKLPVFAGVSDQAVIGLVSRAHWRLCTASEVVLDCGDQTDEVFFIIEGSVRIALRTAFGYEAILNDLGAGEFFGELAAIDGIPRSANATALSRTRLCVVPATGFMDLALSSPAFARRLLRLLSTRQRMSDQRLIEFGTLTVRQRMIAELLRLSRDRGNGERVLSPPPAQHILAARIGARRESVSRELTDMSRAGLLTIGRRAIVLHQPERLGEEVEARLRGKTITAPTVGPPTTLPPKNGPVGVRPSRCI